MEAARTALVVGASSAVELELQPQRTPALHGTAQGTD
jgi:hypothetical protein